ncbi:MAG: type II toxin-antitoxin system RelE/ParE family toxin [Fusobacterium varium]|uniref:Plasmid stabilization protein n=1 Tax=Fusobacterium varium ATCC 27725 TaxID=469618 RepID=A0ABN5JKL9_FUSVA|nr:MULTISPECIES: type II toxin-antitoxin system RelE/ParE family toxin [Fusobacterium]AVQ31746.1 plasmid stabilization protein [Fusobacterium varium ATCC 27725]EES63091.1 toxin-antitoxin system, toxin component, RelE family [Fusobacterium varium ATCC 27725]MCB8563894.1 type II toxin-antitoxin system RelE/ParE family toxin [Fusobacterium ulcerans]MCB8648265.1 type II toxin-antitoxin system RelE/ParE family toxin [Fusobacterium ulcerans]MEE0137170.1 type II toxin-antitoxin system RelE/ParE famil
MDIKYSPAIVKYFKKIKDKQLKERYKMAIDLIVSDYTVGSLKSGDLAGIYSYDIYYNKTNYELAYTLKIEDGEVIIFILAGTRENFYQELKKYLK